MTTNLAARDRLETLARPLHEVVGAADSLASDGLDRAGQSGKALLEAGAGTVQTAARAIGRDLPPRRRGRPGLGPTRAAKLSLVVLTSAVVGVGVWAIIQRYRRGGGTGPGRPDSPDGPSVTANGQTHISPRTPAI